MTEIDFRTFIDGVGNDLKIAIDDIIGAITGIQEDVEKLKVKIYCEENACTQEQALNKIIENNEDI